MNVQKNLAAIGIGALLGLTAATAQAMKLDITATADLKTIVSLDAGTYQVAWIGKAGGGQYDAWSYNTASSGNWRNAFTVAIDGATFTVDKPTATPYANFETAADALTAFASGPYYVYASGVAGSYQPSMLVGTVDTPSFTLTAPTTVAFGVPDNLFVDNTHGVSLVITAAVPEPATYALILGGLAAVAGLARRRAK